MFSAMLTSSKNFVERSLTDGGTDPARFETGTNLGRWTRATGLVGLWDFDEGTGGVAKDISPNAQLGSVFGASWVSGQVHTALNFDGTGNFIDAGNNTALNFSADDTMSISLWVKPDSVTGESYLIDRHDYNLSPYIGYGLRINNGKLGFLAGRVGDTTIKESAQTIDINKWTHVMVTLQSGALRFYINSILDANTYTGIDIQNYDTNFTIGKLSNNASGYFNGVIDDVRVYNRTVSPAEVRKIYAAQFAATIAEGSGGGGGGGGGDTVSPSVPTGLITTSIATSTIDLSWTASTDNIGVTGYYIYRCQGIACTPTVQIADVTTGTTYQDFGLSPSTNYAYQVSAHDLAQNVSVKSTVLETVTQADNVVVGLIRQNCTGYTNCYTTLSAWEAALGGITWGACTPGDLVCANKIAEAKIDGPWTSPDTTAVTIAGWTTGLNNYIKIYTTTAARHSGKWDTGKYRLSSGQALMVGEENVRIDGLQFSTSGSYGTTLGTSGLMSNLDVRISNNIFQGTNSQSQAGILISAGLSGTFKIWNNIIYGMNGNNGHGMDFQQAGVTYYVYNNTVYSSNNNIRQRAGTVIAKNNISQIGASINYTGTFDASSTNNLSSGTDAPGTNPQNSKTVSFISTTLNNEDFHLASTDVSAKDVGVSLSADASLAFSDDIDGQIRSGAWDIGADETTGGSPLPPDTTPPVLSAGAPSGILAFGTTQTTLSLSTNENSTCKYGTTANTAYASIINTLTTTGATAHSQTITGLTNGTSYNYYVRCQDTAGNANTTDYSISFSVAAPSGDTTPPTTSITSPISGVTIADIITISANATDNIAIAGVQFKLDTNTFLGTEAISSPYSYALNTTTITDGSHTLITVARDTSNNYATSSVITITVNNASPPLPDTQAPSVPANLVATSISASQINLSWTASTDNIGVVGYKIYRCQGLSCIPTIQIATSTINSYSNTGLIDATAYAYSVSAYDVVNNESGKSGNASATTAVSTGNVYYISPTGNNATGNGTYNNPWQTITYAISRIVGGDTLILKDGTYTQSIGVFLPNQKYNSYSPPNGSAAAYTIIKAENDGQAVLQDSYIYIGGPYSTSVADGSSYIQIEGLKLLRSYIDITRSHHIKILKVGIKNAVPINERYGGPIGIGCESYNVLVEDSWVIGTMRYGISVSESSNVILRRVLARFDGNTNVEPKAGFNFYGGAQGTGCRSSLVIQPSHDNLCQNCIALDFNSASGLGGGMNGPHATINNKVYGSIFLNLPTNGAIFSEEPPGGGNDMINSVAWGVGEGFSLRDGDPTKTTNFSQLTVGNSNRGIAYWSGSYSTRNIVNIKNSLFYNNSNPNNVGDIINYNWYYPASQAQGTNFITTNPNIQYLTRTPDSGTGEGGVKRGATVEKRYGVTGTLWGELGYDQLTNESLWPWPNEQRIHDDAAEVDSPAYTNTPNRGFAATGSGLYGGPKTLTSYIWEYLGNPCPAEICTTQSPPLPDTQAPSVPANLVATAISSSQINLSWTASTDNIGVTGYRVFRGGVQIATPTTNSYSDTGLSASTVYSYTVAAFDAAGNVSSQSISASATTMAAPMSSCSEANILCVDDTVGSTQEYATIQAAANAAIAGDTVLVYDGNYAGFQVTVSGAQLSPITFKANGQNVLINVDGPTGDGIRLQNISYITVDGLRIQNVSQRCIAARGAVATSPMNSLILKNNYCVYSGVGVGREGIYLSQVANSLVESNTVTYTGISTGWEHAIYLANAGSKNTIIRGNIMNGEGLHINGDLSIGGDGLITGLIIEKNIVAGSPATNGPQNGFSMDGVQNSLIQNNLIYGVVRHGLRAFRIDGAAGPQSLKIINNTIVLPSSSTGWAIKLSEDLGNHNIFNNILRTMGTGGSISLTNNGFFSNYNVMNNSMSRDGEVTILTLAQWQAIGFDSNSLVATESALFVNPGINNYHLLAGSPALNVGAATYNAQLAPTTDLENTIRPQGAAYDIGAYEESGGGGDTIAPTQPTNLIASLVTSSSLTLSWTASTDNIGVVGYKIYRCQGLSCIPTIQIATSTINSYPNTGLISATAYAYSVSA
ncbi:MAG: LamG-like jellyroll fold domain-containing protein [Candidatus Omnitrophota bacterium]|nr:LamG-like jellyroll fold domain-containing protein [Candidatus Omnitrophota bacterium]